jgi:hypothetical protein
MKTICSLYLIFFVCSVSLMNSLRIHNHSNPAQMIQLNKLQKLSRCPNKNAGQSNLLVPSQPVQPIAQPVNRVPKQCKNLPSFGWSIYERTTMADPFTNFYIKFLDWVITQDMRIKSFYAWFQWNTSVQIVIYKKSDDGTSWVATGQKSKVFEAHSIRAGSSYIINPPLEAKKGEIIGIWQKTGGLVYSLDGKIGVEVSTHHNADINEKGALRSGRAYSIFWVGEACTY